MDYSEKNMKSHIENIDLLGYSVMENVISEKECKTIAQKLDKINFQNSMVRKSISHYQKVFNNVNKILNKLKPREKLSVFGTNLFFDLFYTYTNLSKHKILYGIDDFPTKKQLPFPVITSSEIKDKPINKILLCVNPIYIQQVISKLDSKNYNFLSPFIIN